nr:alpha/beta hydrolase-fold protein [Porticoccaceae bacterium]
MIIHTLKLLIFFAVSYSRLIIGSEVPAVSAGTLVTHQQFQSTHVIARDIYVWLPEGYAENSLYDVLYMHDGQALFDAKKTWNGQEWGVDETASKLISNGKVRPFIVVAITNT